MRVALLFLLVAIGGGCAGKDLDELTAPDASGGDADPTDAGELPNACPQAPTPLHNSPCDVGGRTCFSDMLRCRCENAGLRWSCELILCPENPQTGEACTTPGLDCSRGGYRCIAPENVWVVCPRNHFISVGGDRDPQACPTPRPEEGSPCCQAQLPIGAPKDCPYGAERDECRFEHWDRDIQ